MTSTLNPAGTSDVRARREAALNRLHGGAERGKRTRRNKPSRRAVQMKEPRVAEQLGPTPGVFYAIVVIVAVFVMLGLVMVLSATSANQVGGDDSPYSIFNRQLLWATFGLLGMLVAVKVPYQRLRSFVIVGTILVVINHGDRIVAGDWPHAMKIALTYFVPYCVTTWGAITGKRAQWRRSLRRTT